MIKITLPLSNNKPTPHQQTFEMLSRMGKLNSDDEFYQLCFILQVANEYYIIHKNQQFDINKSNFLNYINFQEVLKIIKMLKEWGFVYCDNPNIYNKNITNITVLKKSDK